jgi:hypothetical protein
MAQPNIDPGGLSNVTPSFPGTNNPVVNNNTDSKVYFYGNTAAAASENASSAMYNDYGPQYSASATSYASGIQYDIQVLPSTNNSPAAFNASEGIQSTREYLQAVLEVGGTQQGANAISNVASISQSFAGIASSHIAVNNFTAGKFGTTGNKFS